MITTKAIDVACPSCGVAAGRRCVIFTGVDAPGFHPARLTAAAKRTCAANIAHHAAEARR